MSEMYAAKASKHAPKHKGKLVIRIEEAENGGHHVEHHFEGGDGYSKPEHYVFGKSEHKELLDHLKKHANIQDGDEDDEERE